MHDMLKPKEHHSGLIFSVVLVLVLMMASGFYLVYLGSNATKTRTSQSTTSLDTADDGSTESQAVEQESSDTDFETLVDDENTPVEVDSTAIKELDAIINYIDNNVETDDLSDLDL